MQFEVGQEVAIRSGYGYRSYEIATVERITPGGQVIVKAASGRESRFSSNGRLYGGSADSVWLVELTPAIREQARRQALLKSLEAVKWSSLDTPTLERVVAALNAT
jgi:hypothetical protein